MKPDPVLAQKLELRGQPPLVQGAVGSFDDITLCAQDHASGNIPLPPIPQKKWGRP
jgi:hypothetical protein